MLGVLAALWLSYFLIESKNYSTVYISFRLVTLGVFNIIGEEKCYTKYIVQGLANPSMCASWGGMWYLVVPLLLAHQKAYAPIELSHEPIPPSIPAKARGDSTSSLGWVQ